MFNFCYGCLASIVVLLVAPFLLLRAKSRSGLSQKLGFVPSDFATLTNSIWFHAVSVGEFNAILPLLQEFHSKHSSFNVIVSTTTATGNELAKEKVGEFARVVFMPLDAPFAINNWLERSKPCALVIAETEIWPGLTAACYTRKIPLLVVNGCISPRSFRRYLRLRPIFGAVLKQFAYIGAQSVAQRERYVQLLANKQKPDQITVLGNLKFDGLKQKSAAEIASLRENMKLVDQDQIIIGGSTHEGEESCLLDAFAQLRKKYPVLKLILAPRHPDRFEKVASLIESYGFKMSRFSRSENFAEGAEVYLLDVIGKLSDYYALSTIAFVGGTIAPIGGHNLLEPYVYTVPVICGPHVEKAKDMVQALNERQALLMVPDGKALVQQFDRLLNDKALCENLGIQGHALIQESKGATLRAITLIEKAIGMPHTHAPAAIPTTSIPASDQTTVVIKS
ncbi:MAG: 3-deoxy-D-manno-octulosonic acid transferase [Candidatus Obscuribacterales bacterium]|nr:3-deoxy-D-manno-octulosonic acid transferase [Candidatus Obscuribacterales bacterium]